MAKPGRIFSNSVASRPVVESLSRSAEVMVALSWPLSSGMPLASCSTVTVSWVGPTARYIAGSALLSPGSRWMPTCR